MIFGTIGALVRIPLEPNDTDGAERRAAHSRLAALKGSWRAGTQRRPVSRLSAQRPALGRTLRNQWTVVSRGTANGRVPSHSQGGGTGSNPVGGAFLVSQCDIAPASQDLRDVTIGTAHLCGQVSRR